MIITCPNCNKQFQIDNSLITDEGRDLQCGSCNHIWFYKIEKENDEILKLKEEIPIKNFELKTEKKEEQIVENDQQQIKIKTETNKEKIPKIRKTTSESKDMVNKGGKFFSYLIVFVISFVALIILLDTLKTPLINVFPGLEILLFNLFETLQDIKLFIIDLI